MKRAQEMKRVFAMTDPTTNLTEIEIAGLADVLRSECPKFTPEGLGDFARDLRANLAGLPLPQRRGTLINRLMGAYNGQVTEIMGRVDSVDYQGVLERKTEKLSVPQDDVPQLPEYARLTPSQIQEAETAGSMLDDYIAFANKASPLTPNVFHLAAFLFACAVAIARRLHLAVSTASNTIRPNLYLLFVGHSTRPRKSTALRVLRGLMEKAELKPFLLADRQTPEALALDLTTQLPRSFDSWPETTQNTWGEQRAIAAQRGWLLEEASHLLDSFNRDYSSGLLPMILDMYDAADYGSTRNTITRGLESVENSYINIFGATTFGAMKKHADTTEHWHNGLFARFALVGSDNTGTWQFWPPPLEYPPELVARLKFIAYELLPMPRAKIETIEMGEGKAKETIKRVVIEPPLISSEMKIEDDAWAAWERYAKAVSYDMLPEEPQDVPAKFYASYGRLGTMLIKVAMILATLDATSLPITIQARHVYRAQIFVEGWRANLHHIMATIGEVMKSDAADQVKAALASDGDAWITRRDLCRKLNKRWSEIEIVIHDLAASGEIEREDYKPPKGRKSERYRLILD